jgi:hypothetical protein
MCNEPLPLGVYPFAVDNYISISIYQYITFFCFYFVSLHIWLYVLYVSVNFCKLCVLIFMLWIIFVTLCILLLVYVFSLFCMFRSVYSVSLCCSVYCLCVNVYCTVLLPQGVNRIPVNKYIVYHISYYIQGVTGGTDQTSGGCSLC